MSSVALKKHLFVVYGGFADKRIKKAESGKTFCIDDRTEGDHGAGGTSSATSAQPGLLLA